MVGLIMNDSIAVEPYIPRNSCDSPYNWRCCFDEAARDIRACHLFTGSLDFSNKDIEKIVRSEAGENDGPNWIAVGKMKDGRWFFATAGCDYTGWDCRSGGSLWIGEDEDQILRFGCDDDARLRLYGKSLALPFPIEWIDGTP